eukprot:1160353-Pelagomonas_calceolata.AAC.2
MCSKARRLVVLGAPSRGQLRGEGWQPHLLPTLLCTRGFLPALERKGGLGLCSCIDDWHASA